MTQPTKLTFHLVEHKKHSGKYVLEGTEDQVYPTMMYFRKEWFPDPSKLPPSIQVTVEPLT